MIFRYVVYVPRTGKTLRGTLEASSESAAEKALWERDCVIITLEETATRPQAAAGDQLSLYTLMPTFFGVGPRQVMVFARHLAALLSAGVSLLPALQVLREQAEGALRHVLDGVLRDIQSGVPLSDAIAKQGQAFPPFFARMVRVGERSGNLEVVLRQIALYLEKEHSVRSKIQRAMAYPVFIFALGTVVVALILTFALPALINLYTQFQAELPLATRLLMAIVSFLRANGPAVLVVALSFVALLILAAQTDEGRLAIDNALLRLPLLGAINVRGLLARYTRTLALLLRAGLPLVEIMELVEATVGNRVARRSFAAVRRTVIRGESFSAALAKEPLFPHLLAQMVRVGEETGNLETNLDAVADLYEEETDRAIAALTGILEPALTILMGLMVAFIALSTILPIYNILRYIR